MGSRGATAPHPSQIAECIGEAIAWQTKQIQAQQAGVISGSNSEYTEEEIAMLQAQLKEAGLI